MSHSSSHSSHDRVVRADHVRINRAPVYVGADLPGHGHAPTVQVQRANGRITEIQITCGCGEQIVLDCVYLDGAESAPAGPSS